MKFALQHHKVIPSVALLALSASAGCSGRPSRLAPPVIPDDAGQQAVAKYDASGDGAINGDELAKAPALKAAVKRIDANGDGNVTAEEINARVAVWKNSRVAITRVAVKVRRDGLPLAGATVKLVPDEFLGPAVKPAQAVTDASGTAHLKISDDPAERGVNLGFYRVEVTRPDASGKETIPARYNTATELGTEITRDDPNADRLAIDLTGK